MSGPWIAAFACLWFLVLLLGFTVIGVIRRMTGVLERTERLLAHGSEGASLLTVVPPFEVFDDAGEVRSSEELIQSPTIVLFVDAGCSPCRALAPQLPGDQVAGIPLLVVAGEEGLGANFGFLPNVPVVRQHERDVAKLFKSVMTPHAFVVDEAGVILDRAIPGSVADLERMAKKQRAGTRPLQEVAGG